MSEISSQRNRLIGEICTDWSAMEYQLSNAIWLMSNMKPEIGKIVTAHLDLKQRASMVMRLAHKTNAAIPVKRLAKQVLGDLRSGLIESRNTAVHGIVFSPFGSDEIEIEMHRGKDAGVPKEFDAEQLKKTRKETEACAQKTALLVIELFKDPKHHLTEDGTRLVSAMEAMLKKTLEHQSSSTTSSSSQSSESRD